MFKLAKITIVAGVLATLTACTGHIENKKITAATITYCIRQFQFLKLLVAAARLQINNIRDCADTKKPGISRFFHFRFTLTHMHSRFPAKSAAPCPRHCDWD